MPHGLVSPSAWRARYAGAVSQHQPERYACKQRGLDDKARHELRHAEAAPRLVALVPWLRRMRSKVFDKSPMAKAIDDAHSNREALVVYTTNGELEIDNNRAPRALRWW